MLACIVVLSSAGSAASSGWYDNFYCFFDRESVDIGSRCKGVIDEVVKSWNTLREGRRTFQHMDLPPTFVPAFTAPLEVRGCAQDAETPKGNSRLSMLRAVAVANEVIRLNIPKELVTPIGLGDVCPLIPDAALDPQNRRTLILIKSP